MPLRKLPDPTWRNSRCTSLEHNPPGHLVLAPGTYEWSCPSCCYRTVFTVRRLLFCESGGKIVPTTDPERESCRALLRELLATKTAPRAGYYDTPLARWSALSAGGQHGLVD